MNPIALFVLAQLAGYFVGHSVNTGIKVFATFFCSDHRAIGVNSNFGGLVGTDAGVAGY